MTVATDTGVTARRWRCTTSSSMPTPAASSSSSAPASSCQSLRRLGSRSITEPMVMAWSSCSTMQALTSESYSIQKTCSADDVGYTGTGWAPTAQRAKSKSVHS